MITTLVEFQLPAPMTVEQARQTFLDSAPRYADMPGLVRKYYVLSEDGRKAGGIYLWRSREDADRAYTDAWRAMVRDRYGSAPSLTYLQCPVVVDNLSHEILSDG